MSTTELTGQAPDPDCLHCVLAPVIDRFIREHPLKPSAHVVLELAQVLGELAASNLHNEGKQHQLPHLIQHVSRVVDDSAKGLLANLADRHATKLQ